MKIEWSLLNADQAKSLLIELASSDNRIANSVRNAIKQINTVCNYEDIGLELYEALDCIDVEDLWHNSGSTRYGYVDPTDLAYDMFSDEVKPFKDKFDKYLSLSMLQEAKTYCFGIIHGLYKFEYESNSMFKDWAVDIANNMAINIIDSWKAGCTDNNLLDEVRDHLAKHYPYWW